jgi:glycosyltransferase involved in cell wall biosynthesis
MDKNIVINARFLTQKITGTQRFAVELAIRLKQRIPELRFVAPKNILHRDLANVLNAEIIGKSQNGVVWEQLELPYFLMRMGSPLLVNMCNTAPFIYNNNLVSIMDISYFLHPEWFSRSFSLYYNFLIPRILKKAKKIVTISNSSKADIIKYLHVDKNRINVVYPAVSDLFFNITTFKHSNIYGDYLLFVSSRDPRKNFTGLIRAFQKCNFKDIKLVIVGDSNSLFADSDYHAFIKSNNVIFTVYITDSDLISLYKNAMGFVYPSFFEGFGIPPLEAMACSCPTIVSNVTSLPEVCGNASIYIDPYNIDSIANGLLSLVNDKNLRQELVKRGHERLRMFNWEESTTLMLNIIKYDA